MRRQIAETWSRWCAVVAGDEIGVGGPPIPAVVILLLCLVATLPLLWTPSSAQSAGQPDGALADATPAADPAVGRGPDTRPNIAVVYLDDMRVSDLAVMDNVRELITASGVTFTNSVVTTAACCPARATHLSGQYAHNTGVMHNTPPYGGYVTFKFGKQAAGESVPIWLERAGYRTVFFGKYMNHYPHPRDPYDIPLGFTDWYGLYEGRLGPARYSIYRQTRYAVRTRTSGGPPAIDQRRAEYAIPVPREDGGGQFLLYEGEESHQTAVLMNGAVAAVDGDDGSRPLYLNVWLTAPHAGGDGPVVGGGHYRNKLRPLTVRPEQQELTELQSLLRRGQGLGAFGLDRPESFNEEDVTDKPPFIRQKPKLSREDVADVEIRNALRRAALKSVDRRIADLMAALRRAQERTGRPSYVVFSSDGGFFLGEHRLPYEKNWHYGAATDVPLVITGPDVSGGHEVDVPVANVDLAPTLLHMAGVIDGVTTPLDGRSLLPLLQRPTVAGSASWDQRAVLLEGFWGTTRRRRYSGVRTKTHVYVEHYAQRDGRTLLFTELYDRRADPGYERNLLQGKVAERSEAVAWRLDTLLDRLRTCAGRACDQHDQPMSVAVPPQSARAAGTGPRQGRDDQPRSDARAGAGNRSQGRARPGASARKR